MDKDIFCCEICFVLFSTKASPRMLPCGHSCCTSCVTKIIATNKKCHMCRITLTEDDVQKYPVNFYILSACDIFYNKTRRIELVQQRLTSTLDKHEEVVKLALAKTVKLDKLTIDGRKLQEFTLIEGSSLNVIEVDAAIDDIEKQMTDVVETFHIDFNTDSECNIDLRSSQCSESKEFLAKIQREIAFGRSIAAVATINGEEKLAKIKINNEKLFLHALDKGNSTDGNVTRVDFHDLQEALLPLNKMLHGFLLLDYDPKEAPYLAVIEILNDASIVQGIQFLKLCSGELGNSYKGFGCYQESGEYSRYRLIGGSHRVLRKKKTSVLRVKSFDFQTKDKYQLFSGEAPNVFTRGTKYSDDRHLFFQNDGSFELHLMPDNNVKEICIGKITQCKFSKLSLENITILDCGIAFQLPI